MRDPLNALDPVFGLTLNETVPVPLPVAPAVIEAHPTLLAAAQPHPAGAVTVTELEPPDDPNDAEDEDREYMHEAAFSTIVAV